MPGFLAVALVACGFVASGAARDDTPAPIRGFFHSGAICSAATVEGLARDANRMNLTISIGPNTAAGMFAL